MPDANKLLIRLHKVGINIPIYDVTQRFILHSGDKRSQHVRCKSNHFIQPFHDISLDIGAGDRIAFLGSNGAGKSSLLKTITGIYTPTSGRIDRRKTKILPFLHPLMGFIPELTGYENIKLRLLLMGITWSKLGALVEKAKEISGLDADIYRPYRTYSSGMKMRLTLAIIVLARVDIFILDEVLVMLDSAFCEKFHHIFHQVLTRDQALLFVSHRRQDVLRYCNKGVVLDRGNVAYFGPVTKALEIYDNSIQKQLDLDKEH